MPTSVRPRRTPRTARTRATPAGSPTSPAGEVRKAFLDPQLLDEARASLGASSERGAVEMPLDLVGFRRELAEGARLLRRLGLSRID